MIGFSSLTKFAAVPAAALALAIAATPLHAEEKSMDRTITVSATGTAQATPMESPPIERGIATTSG